jgi:hypothetical protein
MRVAVTFSVWTILCGALWAIEPSEQGVKSRDSQRDMIVLSKLPLLILRLENSHVCSDSLSVPGSAIMQILQKMERSLEEKGK